MSGMGRLIKKRILSTLHFTLCFVHNFVSEISSRQYRNVLASSFSEDRRRRSGGGQQAAPSPKQTRISTVKTTKARNKKIHDMGNIELINIGLTAALSEGILMMGHVSRCLCEVDKSGHLSYTGERHSASQQRVKPLCGVALPPRTPGRVPQNLVTDVFNIN